MRTGSTVKQYSAKIPGKRQAKEHAVLAGSCPGNCIPLLSSSNIRFVLKILSGKIYTQNKISWKFLRLLLEGKSKNHTEDYEWNKAFPRPPSERAGLTDCRVRASFWLVCLTVLQFLFFASFSPGAGQQGWGQFAITPLKTYSTSWDVLFLPRGHSKSGFPHSALNSFFLSQRTALDSISDIRDSNSTRNFQ